MPTLDALKASEPTPPAGAPALPGMQRASPASPSRRHRSARRPRRQLRRSLRPRPLLRPRGRRLRPHRRRRRPRHRPPRPHRPPLLRFRHPRRRPRRRSEPGVSRAPDRRDRRCGSAARCGAAGTTRQSAESRRLEPARRRAGTWGDGGGSGAARVDGGGRARVGPLLLAANVDSIHRDARRTRALPLHDHRFLRGLRERRSAPGRRRHRRRLGALRRFCGDSNCGAKRFASSRSHAVCWGSQLPRSSTRRVSRRSGSAPPTTRARRTLAGAERDGCPGSDEAERCRHEPARPQQDRQCDRRPDPGGKMHAAEILERDECRVVSRGDQLPQRKPGREQRRHRDRADETDRRQNRKQAGSKVARCLQANSRSCFLSSYMDATNSP